MRYLFLIITILISGLIFGEEIDIVIRVKNENGRIYAKSIANEILMERNDFDILGLRVTNHVLNDLKSHPDIVSVDQDYVMSHHEKSITKGKKEVKNYRGSAAEEIPWGVQTVLQDVAFWENDNVSNEGEMKICIVDTGYTLGHEDLPLEYVDGKDNADVVYEPDWDIDLDERSHGTFMAGVVAAIGNNGIGVRGVIPDDRGGKFQLLIGKGWNYINGYYSLSAIISAIKGCVDQGAKVIIFPSECDNCYTRTYDDYLKEVYNEGVLLFAGSGEVPINDPTFPGSYRSVISVASIDENLERSCFSQFNNQVELSAPGQDIESTVNETTNYGYGYEYYDGTAFAAAYAGAAAGLLWMQFPTCSNAEIRRALARTAKDLGKIKGCDKYYGYGLVQAKDAYEFLQSDGNCGGVLGPEIPYGGCAELYCVDDEDCDDGNECSTNTCNKSTQQCQVEYDLNAFELDIQFKGDRYPSDNKWALRDSSDTTLVCVSFEATNGLLWYDMLFSSTKDYYCSGDYTYEITDAFNDGFCCSDEKGYGYYKIYRDDYLVGSGAEFEASQTVSLNLAKCSNDGDCDDGLFCTIDTCDSATGKCVQEFNYQESNSILVEVKTDENPRENSWIIRDSTGDSKVLIASGGPFGKPHGVYPISMKLCSGYYNFTFYDLGKDGIKGNGYYEIYMQDNLIARGGNSTKEEQFVSFEVKYVPPTSEPTPAPTLPPSPTQSPTNIPSLIPTQLPTPPGPTQSPTSAPTQPCVGDLIKIDLMTDKKPQETSWDLKYESDSILLANHGPYYSPLTFYSIKTKLCNGNYIFTIYDSGGDGICCSNDIAAQDMKTQKKTYHIPNVIRMKQPDTPKQKKVKLIDQTTAEISLKSSFSNNDGYYKIYVGDELIFSGGDFGSQESTVIEVDGSFIT